MSVLLELEKDLKQKQKKLKCAGCVGVNRGCENIVSSGQTMWHCEKWFDLKLKELNGVKK